MRIGRLTWAALGLAMLLATGCDRAGPAGPPPVAAEVPDDASGHYCGMLLSDHEGPKGQIHLESREEPIWFSSVRDTVAFLRLPEEAKDVSAVYVNDMGLARSWEHPEPGTWVDAREAWFVVESTMQGGMGAPEAVPFSTQPAAEEFRDEHGGRVVRLDGIADDYVLGPVDLSSSMPGHGSDHAAAGGHGQHASGGHQHADPDAPADDGSTPQQHDH